MNIVVTGATKGIGSAIVDTFKHTAKNLIVCARTDRDMQVMANNLKKECPNLDVHYIAVDLSDKSQVLKFGDFVLDVLKDQDIDVLINNAGVFLPGFIDDTAGDFLEKMIDVNVYSVYYLTQKLLPKFKQQRHGHIFNMCSIASIIAYPSGGAYTISKFALLGFSKVLREELKQYYVKVTTVMPGATWSDSWKGVDLPQERLMPASDIAQCIYNAYTLSKQSVVEEIIIRPQLGDL